MHEAKEALFIKILTRGIRKISRFYPLLAKSIAKREPRGAKSYRYDPTKCGLDASFGMTSYTMLKG